VLQGDLRASATGAIPAAPGSKPFPIPWGFVSQEKILESVVPDRAGGGGMDTRIVEKRAEHLNLDSWEFLRVRVALALRVRTILHAVSRSTTQAEIHPNYCGTLYFWGILVLIL